MVIAGKIRGNAPQLADYLLTLSDNERVTIMDVDGQQNADASHLKDMLYTMELNSELTRSKKSVYHAYINPNPEDSTDRAMTMEEWQQSVDILTRQLGYENQRRVVVLHEKPGKRIHAHVVYERYNHERGVMATYKHNYNAHDKARAEIEKQLNHKPTPQKNKNRDHHKQALTQIWKRTTTAGEFVKEANANGYQIAKGTDRPFHVVDSDGISFNLVRKLDGIKTTVVKQRLDSFELISEKQAIAKMQSAKKQRNIGSDVVNEIKTDATTEREEQRRKFLQQMKEVRERNQSITRDITFYILMALNIGLLLLDKKPKEIKATRSTALTIQFINNTFDMTAPAEKHHRDIHPYII